MTAPKMKIYPPPILDLNNPQVGDQLFFMTNENSPTPHDVVVTKVGRKYWFFKKNTGAHLEYQVYLDQEMALPSRVAYMISSSIPRLVCGRVWPNREAYRAEQVRKDLWQRIQKAVESYRPPDGVSLEMLQELHAIIEAFPCAKS